MLARIQLCASGGSSLVCILHDRTGTVGGPKFYTNDIMAADYCDILKQGYVRFKPNKMGAWNKRWAVLYKPSSRGPRRIEKYDDEKSAVSCMQCKLINLTEVANVIRLPSHEKKHAVSIVFSGEDPPRQFCCESEHDANQWFRILREECLHSVQNFQPVDLLNGTSKREINERFHVYMCPSPKTEIYGECILQITDENLHLLDIDNPARKLLTWPLTSIRNYRRDKHNFTIESGRHCSTGEALFVFNTVHGEDIYQRVKGAIQAIAAAARVVTEPLMPLNRPASSNVSRTKSLPLDNMVDISNGRTPLHHSNSAPESRASRRRNPPQPPPRLDEEQPPDQSATAATDQTDSGYLQSLPTNRSLADSNNNEDDDDDYENSSTVNRLSKTGPSPRNSGANGPTSSQTSPQELDYIYEEKQLTQDFRQYLHTRKDDDK